MALIITDECINCDVCEPECPNEAISQGAETVSYTHLGIKGHENADLLGAGCAAGDIVQIVKNDPAGARKRQRDTDHQKRQHGIEAVSYTHLDVYKRQPLGRVSMGTLNSGLSGRIASMCRKTDSETCLKGMP